jgi:ATP-binding cassette subfamily G (WHITE) protein 2 (SNQ2)
MTTPRDEKREPSPHVDVQQAVDEFNRLSRQLSLQSHVESGRPDTARTVVSQQDLEKGEVKDQSTQFNLRDYLTSSNDANQAAGIRHKVWDLDERSEFS